MSKQSNGQTAHEIYFAVEDATKEDEDVMVALGLAEEMGTLEGFETTLVARSGKGELAGFCRVKTYQGISHVNPLITAPAFRNMGVGRLLMEAASRRYGELRFVARGCAAPFYRRIGSVEVGWEQIAPEVATDCDGCSLYLGCHPQPMIYRV